MRASFWRKEGFFVDGTNLNFTFLQEFVEIADYKILALWKIQIAKAKKKNRLKHKFKFFLLTLTRPDKFDFRVHFSYHMKKNVLIQVLSVNFS